MAGEANTGGTSARPVAVGGATGGAANEARMGQWAAHLGRTIHLTIPIGPSLFEMKGFTHTLNYTLTSLRANFSYMGLVNFTKTLCTGCDWCFEMFFRLLFSCCWQLLSLLC